MSIEAIGGQQASRGASLFVFVLTIQSSHADNIERDVVGGGSPDTVQFMLARGQAWRIRTFAIDRDVHVWHVGSGITAEALHALADKNTRDNYGDVIGRAVAVHGNEALESLRPGLLEAGLPANLEVAPDDAFAFWTPDAGGYRTRTRPD